MYAQNVCTFKRADVMANTYSLKQVKDLITKARKELKEKGIKTIQKGLGQGLQIQIRQSSLTYTARVKINGKATTKVIGSFDDMTLSEAYKQASSLNTDIVIQELEKAKTPLFKDFWKQYREETDKAKGLSKAWIFNNNAFYNTVLHVFDDLRISDITPREVIDRTNGITTHSNLVGSIRALNRCMVYARNTGIITFNQLADITKLPQFRLKKSERKGHPFVSAENLREKLFEPLALSDLELQVFTLLVCLTSCRMGEILHLKWSDIDFSAVTDNTPYGVITIKNIDTKTKNDTEHADHIISITRQMFNALKHWKEYKADFDTDFLFNARTNLNKPLSETQIMLPKTISNEVHFHSLRKTVSTFLNSQKMEYYFDKNDIEQILGHKIDITVRGIYNKYDNLKENYRLLSFWSDYLEREQLTEPFLKLIK